MPSSEVSLGPLTNCHLTTNQPWSLESTHSNKEERKPFWLWWPASINRAIGTFPERGSRMGIMATNCSPCFVMPSMPLPSHAAATSRSEWWFTETELAKAKSRPSWRKSSRKLMRPEIPSRRWLSAKLHTSCAIQKSRLSLFKKMEIIMITPSAALY